MNQILNDASYKIIRNIYKHCLSTLLEKISLQIKTCLWKPILFFLVLKSVYLILLLKILKILYINIYFSFHHQIAATKIILFYCIINSYSKYLNSLIGKEKIELNSPLIIFLKFCLKIRCLLLMSIKRICTQKSALPRFLGQHQNLEFGVLRDLPDLFQKRFARF